MPDETKKDEAPFVGPAYGGPYPEAWRGAPAYGGPPKSFEQVYFDVMLSTVEPVQMINTIRLIRDVTGCALGEAKRIYDEASQDKSPVLKKEVYRVEARDIEHKFEAVGAKVLLQ